MANLVQLKMMEDLDGILLVDKPEGMQFSTVIKTLKRKFGLVKVGHGGALDTMASGLFVLLVGGANKFAEMLMNADRAYEGAFIKGKSTDTGDIYGREIPQPERVASLAELKGDVFQVEPRYCAVRREGAANYEVVDTGEHKQFLSHVYKFDVSSSDSSNEAHFSLLASKGVIVRALVSEMGAVLSSLRRTRVGKFDVADAVPFSKILEMDSGEFSACVIPASRALR